MTSWNDTVRDAALYHWLSRENDELRKRVVELEKCVKQQTPPVVPRSFERDRYLHAVCAHYSMAETEILSPSVSIFVSEPRHVLCYLLRLDHGMSLEAIGKYINRHHSTVMHGVRQARLKHKRQIAAVRELLSREVS